MPPEQLTRGLPPPDPRSLCPLSSTEFVETPLPEQNSWVRHWSWSFTQSRAEIKNEWSFASTFAHSLVVSAYCFVCHNKGGTSWYCLCEPLQCLSYDTILIYCSWVSACWLRSVNMPRHVPSLRRRALLRTSPQCRNLDLVAATRQYTSPITQSRFPVLLNPYHTNVENRVSL